MASYAALAGQPIIAGRAAVPSWITSQTVGTWGTVPAPIIDNLDPTDDPAINPSYPSSPWGQYRNRVNAWCGGCFDDSPAAPTFHIPIGGGHADYMTNDDSRINLGAEVPRWTNHHRPSGALPDAILLNDGQEATGLYSDGGIRPPHTYNKLVFVPGVGCYVSVQGNVSFSGSAGTARTIKFDPLTGLGALVANNPFAGSFSGSGACFDPTRGNQGSIWNRGRALGVMSRYDVELDSWTSHGGNVNVSADTALEYLPGDDLLIWINTGLAQSFGVFNPTNNTYTYPGFSGSFVGLTLTGQCSPSWSDAHNGFLIWDNGSNTTQINLINKPANPRTDPWPISQLAVDPSNTITPSVRASNGTYGRAFYSATLGCFFVVNSTTTQFYFFRIA